MTLNINPLIAAGVVVTTAATDAVYVMFTSAVNARRPARAATWSSMWYLLAAFAVISYTGNPVYALFAAAGSWMGAYSSVRWLSRTEKTIDKAPPPAHKPPAPIS